MGLCWVDGSVNSGQAAFEPCGSLTDQPEHGPRSDHTVRNQPDSEANVLAGESSAVVACLVGSRHGAFVSVVASASADAQQVKQTGNGVLSAFLAVIAVRIRLNETEVRTTGCTETIHH